MLGIYIPSLGVFSADLDVVCIRVSTPSGLVKSHTRCVNSQRSRPPWTPFTNN